MRFMVIVKATPESEAGILPTPELLSEMMKYNEELVKAGVMAAADGLHASSKGARVKFSGGKTTVTDGPFAETKELIAGFWIFQVKSKQEAIDWVRRRSDARHRTRNPPNLRGRRLRRQPLSVTQGKGSSIASPNGRQKVSGTPSGTRAINNIMSVDKHRKNRHASQPVSLL